MPEGGEYLWRLFHQLSARRGSNGFGLNPLGPLEIEAWLRLHRRTLAPWEVEIVEMIDDLFMAEQVKAAAKGGGPERSNQSGGSVG